jgi:hypothetical protein
MGARIFLLLVAIGAASFSIATRAEPPKSSWVPHVISPRTGAIQLQMRVTAGQPTLLVRFSDGVIRIYSKSQDDWTETEVGSAPGGADAALAGDNVVHAESAAIAVHLRTGDGWNTESIPDAPLLDWTAIAAGDLDSRHGIDLAAGARYQRAVIGWFESLSDPGDSAGWRWHPLSEVGWVTAILLEDMDSDEARDILYADRFGGYRGVYWLKNPKALSVDWKRYQITEGLPETVFLTTGDVDQDKLLDLVSAAKPNEVWLHRRRAMHGREWQNFRVTVPAASGTIHAVRLADINRDGRSDLIVAIEDAETGQPGILWLNYSRSFAEDTWRTTGLSSAEGGSFHGLEILDMDSDGDLDVLTSESRKLGVLWFENPSITAPLTSRK